MKFTIEKLALSASKLSDDADHALVPYIAGYSKVKQSDVTGYRILKRSVDARNKPDVKVLYRIEAELKPGVRPRPDMKAVSPDTEGIADRKSWRVPSSENRPSCLIAGTGPAGLFAALALAEAGCRPLLLDRGFDVERRKRDIDAFFSTRSLNPESNLLFGEGGAGTWSDGKLFTRIRDPRAQYVLETFVEHGAPEEILYFSHPHLGSDRLPAILSSMRARILALGGEIRWGAAVESILYKGGRCDGVLLASGERHHAQNTLLACGHSARNLIRSLALEHRVPYRMKGFQTGMRIEHKQSFINARMYGVEDSFPVLGAADYQIHSRPSAPDANDGVTSFCMCPGGELLPATSDPGRLCTNGMSVYARSGTYANAALVTTLDADFFRTPEEAFCVLDGLERAAFEAGGGDYTLPAQNALAFLNGDPPKLSNAGTSSALGRVPSRLDLLLPEDLRRTFRRALAHFERTIPGFAANGTLYGFETRVSSPVRFLRDEQRQDSMPGLYLAGEFAGMAGGIMSAAVDGIRMAEAMLHS